MWHAFAKSFVVDHTTGSWLHGVGKVNANDKLLLWYLAPQNPNMLHYADDLVTPKVSSYSTIT
jgi:hypothetical protein